MKLTFLELQTRSTEGAVQHIANLATAGEMQCMKGKRRCPCSYHVGPFMGGDKGVSGDAR